MGAVLHRENVDGTILSPCSDSEQKAIKKSSEEKLENGRVRAPIHLFSCSS